MFEAPRPHWLARSADSSVAWCFLLSILLHLIGTLAYQQVVRIARTRPDTLPRWVLEAVAPEPPRDALLEEINRLRQMEEEPAPEVPVTFVEVDPAAVTEEEPPKTPFYSTANTVAANVKPPETITGQPKIEGTQEKVVRTFDNDRPKPVVAVQPVKPVEAAPQVVEIPQALPPVESKPLGGPPVGTMAFAKPVPLAKVPKPQEEVKPMETPKPVQSPPMLRPQPRPLADSERVQKPTRPRTLAEARANKGMLVGETMKQEGGVARLSIVPSLDVKASPFGIYDAAMIYVISSAWYALLDESRFTYERSGKVVIRFTLHSDGTISGLKIMESEVGDTLAFMCETAIIKPQPFNRWPAIMRQEVGADTREITFTFHYH